MYIVKKIFFILCVILLSGCSLIENYYKEESFNLYKEFGAMNTYFYGEMEEAEKKNTKRSLTRLEMLEDAEEELSISCEVLQRVGFKKFIGEVITTALKIATVGSLPTCEGKVLEMQAKFPDYKKYKLSMGN